MSGEAPKGKGMIGTFYTPLETELTHDDTSSQLLPVDHWVEICITLAVLTLGIFIVTVLQKPTLIIE